MARIWCTNRSGFHPASAAFQGPRQFGISLPPYDALNLGLKVGDDRDHVMANRSALSAACELAEIRFMDQVHSDRMVEGEVDGSAESCDGIFIRRDSWNDRVGLAVQAADCVPLVLSSENVIAAVHVGRVGLVKGMTESALAACYPLSEETYLAAAERYPKSIFSEMEQKIDVAAGVISILESREIEWSWFGGARECVSCDGDYYSYRRDRVTGRQAMVVAW